MENPLRRPRGPAANEQTRPADLENQRHRHKDDDSRTSVIKAHLMAMSGEFVGTTLFLYFAFGGTQIANTIPGGVTPNLNQLLFISLSFGFSLAVTAWVFYRVSGGLFNPAVHMNPAGFGEEKLLTVVTGDTRFDDQRCLALGPWSSALSSPNAGWYGSCGLGSMYVSRPDGR